MKAPRFSLRQLHYFVAIAEAGSLSEAASRLHVSQPGLSQALTDLEKALGIQLTVRRKAHGVTLTPSGEEVLRHARELLRHSEELEFLTAGTDVLSGVLSLGCQVTLAPTVLPPLLQEFHALHPSLEVDFKEGTQDVLQERLTAGQIDLAIIYDMEVHTHMNRVAIAQMRPHVLLPEDHPMAGQPEVSLRDLESEPMVLLDAPPSSHNTLGIFERLGIVPDVRYRPTTFELTRALVGRGLGYALLFQRPVNTKTYEGRELVVKEISEPVAESQVLIAWPKTVQLNRKAQAFVDFCTGHPQPRPPTAVRA